MRLIGWSPFLNCARSRYSVKSLSPAISMARKVSTIHADFNRIFRQAYPNAMGTIHHPGKCEVQVDGVFNWTSFLPNVPSVPGHLKLTSVLSILDINALLLYWHDTGPQYLDVGDLGHLVYITSLRFSSEPELYDCGLDKQPVRVVNELVYVGRTSFKTRVSLYIPQVEKPVAQKDFGVVFVDQETRRPVVPPAWWRDKHEPYSRPGEGRIALPPFDFKASTHGPWHQEDVHVQTTDMDANRHCNWSSFVWFCQEAYGRSQFRQFGRNPEGDPFRDVKSLVCAYKGEAGLGDLLTVYFVQDSSDKDTYHFQVVNKKNSSVIFECHTTFFPLLTSKI